MTFLDMIEIYNVTRGNDENDISSLFTDIDIDERLNKDILVGSLLDECGAMRCIYETTATFKYFSDLFFKKYKWNIGKMLDTLELKYDPITNMNLEWTETTKINQNLATEEEANENRTKLNTGTQTSANTGTQTNANTGTQTNANTGTQTNASNETEEIDNTGTQSNDYSEEQTNTVSAMNSSDYEPDNHRDTSGGNTRTDNLSSSRTDNISSTRTDNLSSTRTDNLSSTRTDDLTETRTDDLEENITAGKDRSKNEDLTWDEEDKHYESGYKDTIVQDLIAKERKISEFSIYGWIAKKYAKEMFLLVY